MDAFQQHLPSRSRIVLHDKRPAVTFILSVLPVPNYIRAWHRTSATCLHDRTQLLTSLCITPGLSLAGNEPIVARAVPGDRIGKWPNRGPLRLLGGGKSKDPTTHETFTGTDRPQLYKNNGSVTYATCKHKQRRRSNKIAKCI